MNFELADKLYELLKGQKLDQAIALAEQELREIPTTDFHKILDRTSGCVSDSLVSGQANFRFSFMGREV